MKIEDIKKYAIKNLIKYIAITLVLILFYKSHIIEHFLTEDNVKTIQFILCIDILIAFLFILASIPQVWILISSFRITNYMKNHNIDYLQNVIWWNKSNSFFLENIIFISKLRLTTFTYSDIKSIQLEKEITQDSQRYSRSSGYTYSIILYPFNSSKKYKIYCCKDKRYYPTEEYKNVINLITGQNSNITVLDMKKLNPLEQMPFW